MTSRPGVQDEDVRADLRCVGDPQADLLSPAAQFRCPACAAALRPGAPWCTLCYADLRPPEREPAPAPPPPSATTGSPAVPTHRFDPLTAPAQDLGLPGRHASGRPVATAAADPDLSAAPTWPCTACGQPNPFAAAVCALCGTAFLATLREGEEPLLRLPLVGDIGRLSRQQRLGLAALAILLVLSLTAVLSLLTT